MITIYPLRRLGKPTVSFALGVGIGLSASADLIKAANAQELQWATQAGADGGRGIATTAHGESYIAGSFAETAIFGEGELNETTLTDEGRTGAPEIFVAKYDREGALVWAKSAGKEATIDGHAASSIATTPRGESYITGLFSSSATFGPGEPNETTLRGRTHNIFVAKYARDGALLWAKHAPGHGFDDDAAVGNSIAVTPHGDSYVTGTFDVGATFGPGESNETDLISSGGFSRDIFIARFDSKGLLLWAKRAGGSDPDEGRDIAATSWGHSYVTGFFVGTAIFGPGEANETELTAAGGSGMFVAKYDRDGQLLWATSAFGSGFVDGRGIATTPGGEVLVAGGFTSEAVFGPGSPAETALTAEGSDAIFGPSDIFIAKYDRDGALVWAKRAGGTGIDGHLEE